MALPRINSLATTSSKPTSPKLSTTTFLAPKHDLNLSPCKQPCTDQSTSTNSPSQAQCSIKCCSESRRPEYFLNRIPDDTYVRIMDTTLRDGARAPGRAMTRPEKLAVARKLAELGLDVIEVGFPASSEDDLETSKLIAREIGNGVDELGFVPAIGALARCDVRGDVDAAWEAVREARRPRVHVFLATSEILMKRELKRTPEEVLVLAKQGVSYAKSLGCHDIEFVCVDAGRSDKEFLYRVYGEAIKAGATTVTVTDTVGQNFPTEVERMILDLKANVEGIEDVVIAAHCHNDLGLATANSLAAAQAGARQIEVTINGIGERAGNASLEEVEEYSGLSLQPHKAIVGTNVLAHASGIHDQFISDGNIESLVSKHQQSGLAWKLVDIQVNSHQCQGLPTVNVKLVDVKGLEHSATSEAVDQVNAAFYAIDLIVKVPVTVVECSTNSDTADNTIWAQVKVSVKQASQDTISGSAQSFNLVESCALAYIDALNQILAFGFPAK
ncbi:hypothetical protein TIFTF001_019346 [Ficus carica]|uniref:2-isopropylmalate synthase n=1 Tax=Ficus carica TaxID=3494 RepID=A0AA88DBP3_FICCA|nr:hypothetical protein TIFTF001_019346 [Ficus carica]